MIQVLHTGSKSELAFDCKIKGGKPIRNYSKLNKGVHGYFRTCIDELMPILVYIFGLYIPKIILEIIGISYKSNQLLASVIFLLFVVLEMIFYKKNTKKD